MLVPSTTATGVRVTDGLLERYGGCLLKDGVESTASRCHLAHDGRGRRRVNTFQLRLAVYRDRRVTRDGQSLKGSPK